MTGGIRSVLLGEIFIVEKIFLGGRVDIHHIDGVVCLWQTGAISKNNVGRGGVVPGVVNIGVSRVNVSRSDSHIASGEG